jgi:hypothetical protein
VFTVTVADATRTVAGLAICEEEVVMLGEDALFLVACWDVEDVYFLSGADGVTGDI